jgi:hypothetical protein
MDDTMLELDFCFAYLDDILLFSQSLEETRNIYELSSTAYRSTRP